ncbi:MAG TPA: hypothetical protein VMW48_19355, partial [Vicinamibacterales bacterium]|nr:hypothetical protein [Vicinamibacterales bacterium]
MTHVVVAIARRLNTIACVVAALSLSACATSRAAGNSQTTTAPAAAGQATGAAATQKPPVPRHTATSTDGTKIVYDVEGTGPALLLLHGGGQTGRSWAERGYVEKLRDKFTVI